MGSIELNETMKIAANIVDKWEKLAIATTDLDGPLSPFGKASLIRIFSEALETHAGVVQTLKSFEQPKKKPGRPPKICQSQA